MYFVLLPVVLKGGHGGFGHEIGFLFLDDDLAVEFSLDLGDLVADGDAVGNEQGFYAALGLEKCSGVFVPGWTIDQYTAVIFCSEICNKIRCSS